MLLEKSKTHCQLHISATNDCSIADNHQTPRLPTWYLSKEIHDAFAYEEPATQPPCNPEKRVIADSKRPSSWADHQALWGHL